MIDDPRYSPCALTAAIAWTASMGLMAGAWVALGLGGDPHVSILMATSSCVLAGVAGVSHLRVMVGQTRRLIRLSAGLERPGADVREFEIPRPRR